MSENDDDGGRNVVKNNHGTVIQVGRDATFNFKSGAPTDEELKVDFKITKIKVTNNPPYRVAPHCVGVQVSAERFDHPQVHVKIKTTAPIKDQFVADGPDGIGSRIASSVDGNIFEYTEGAPGLLRGQAYKFVLFSDSPIEITSVDVENNNPLRAGDQNLWALRRPAAR